MKQYVCHLESKELAVAAMTGVLRTIENIKANTRNSYRGHRDWNLDINAAIGEMVVARLLNEYWCPGTWRSPDLVRNKLEVRSTAYANGCLILHPEDHDDHPFVLVTLDGDVARVRGWLFGADGKREEFWRVEVQRPLRHPCFMVPHLKLRPMDDLLALLKDNRLEEAFLQGAQQ